MGPARTVVIDRRFNGPPGSGNGGYACGTAAEQLGAVPAEVTLSTPPPIGVALDVVDVDGGIELRAGDTVVAQARAWDGDVEVPAPPTPDALETAAAALDLDDYDAIHPFPTCFVCGPRRAEGDGLRIFPGPLGDGQTVAWRWVPSPTTTDDQGSVRVPITWAALDCLSGMAWMAATDGTGSGDAVLGRLAARIERRPGVGEATVVAGWRGLKRAGSCTRAPRCGPPPASSWPTPPPRGSSSTPRRSRRSAAGDRRVQPVGVATNTGISRSVFFWYSA